MDEEARPLHLTQAQIAQFESEGFLAIPALLDDEDLRPLEAEYAQLLDQVAGRLEAAGEIPQTFAALPFEQRFAKVLQHYPDLHRFFNISLPLINGPVAPAHYHMHAGPAVFHLLRHPKILDVVEDLLGPEIASSPVQQMRMKPPEANLDRSNADHSNVGQTTWHQDIVAILPEADATRQLTVWLAITEASEANGCLVSVPGSHKKGALVHCANDALASEPHVPDALMAGARPRALPVRRGGVVLFHKMNLHCALPNRSDRLRWSVDLRYHPVGQASGRPAFPGFVARSRAHPESELHDPLAWAASWDAARQRIVSGQYAGPVFADNRWHDAAVC